MAQTSSNPFIKNLASSDRTVRTKALASLRTYLSRSQPFSSLDFLKLWKGLFYCMWMQDKPRNQQNLARDLADLVDVLKGQDNVLGFLQGFWKTMAREWGSIDGLRMDKYLFLVRCYLGKGFEVCAARDEWEVSGEESEERSTFMEKYLEVLEAIPLSPRDAKVPNGLRYHVIDIYVDELEKVDVEHKAPLDVVLRPLRRLGKETITKTVRERGEEALEDARLRDWMADGAGDEEADGVREDATDAARKQIASESDAMEAEDEDGEFGGFGD